MTTFDVSLNWHILVPAEVAAAKTAGRELAAAIASLRANGQWPDVLNAATADCPDSDSIIILNSDGAGAERGGYTWRTGKNRIEIHGDSGRGLCNGVFDFLRALGFNWTMEGAVETPPLADNGCYTLKADRAYVSSNTSRSKEWVVLSNRDLLKDNKDIVRMAARCRKDALMISLSEENLPLLVRIFGGLREARERLILRAQEYDLPIEVTTTKLD